MVENGVLVGLSFVFGLAAMYNFKIKKDIEIPTSLDRTKIIALGVLLIVFIMIVFILKGNILAYIFVITSWILTYSLMTSTGFTSDYVYFFGGVNIFLSKRKIEDLKYLKVVSTDRQGIVKTILRGNLVKRNLYFEERFLDKIKKLITKKGSIFYSRYENPEDVF